MSDTKEKILTTALRLFAKDGYEAVSVSTIAGELGMTKGALYKHYKNKQDIFDSIVRQMFKIDQERAQKYEVPKEEYEKEPDGYKNQSLENIKNFTLAQLSFWVEDDFAANFRKMLVLEQYRNADMAQLYDNCIKSGPVEYVEGLFREMMNEGVLKKSDPKLLAVEFYAPLYLLINISDNSNEVNASEILKNHIEKFIELNALERNDYNERCFYNSIGKRE